MLLREFVYMSRHSRYYNSNVVEICNNYIVLVTMWEVQQEAGGVPPYILMIAEGS